MCIRHTSFMTSKCKNQGKNEICSVKIYGAPCTVMHDLRARKKRRKTSVARANAKVTFHTITSLWVASDLSTLYFKLINFLTQWEGLHKIRNLFLQGRNAIFKMSPSLNCSMEISRMHRNFQNWNDMKHEPRKFWLEVTIFLNLCKFILLYY